MRVVPVFMADCGNGEHFAVVPSACFAFPIPASTPSSPETSPEAAFPTVMKWLVIDSKTDVTNAGPSR